MIERALAASFPPANAPHRPITGDDTHARQCPEPDAFNAEDAIAKLVDRFYAKVRQDELLGPVFARALGDGDSEWAAHLGTLRDFWSSVILTSGRYKGDPFSVHRRIGGLNPALFTRWLALFHETCQELFPPAVAAGFEEKAERIARSLKMGLFEILPERR